MRSVNHMAICVTAAGGIWLSTLPAAAFTCEDVRNLSTDQQNYWSQRLHLSSLQRHLIWVACYQNYHPDRLRVARR